MTDKTFPERQELQAFFICWIAVFLPEALKKTFVVSLRSTVNDLRDRKSWGTSIWYRLLPLEIALYAATGRNQWLDTHRFNFDHHNRSLRNLVIESLAYVADRLQFDDPELQERAASNLRSWHLGCEDAAFLLLAARGEPVKKRQAIEGWIRDIKLPVHVKDLLAQALAGEFISLPFFSESFSKVALYVASRLALASESEGQLSLLHMQQQSKRHRRSARNPAIGANVWDVLQSRYSKNPLMGLFRVLEKIPPAAKG